MNIFVNEIVGIHIGESKIGNSYYRKFVLVDRRGNLHEITACGNDIEIPVFNVDDGDVTGSAIEQSSRLEK